MDKAILEREYPISFREADSRALGGYIAHRQSVDLIGMKRVGISNFLRFFLNHPDVVKTYISPTEKFLFIPVDLNDLVERELFPFWALTMKRIVDTIEQSDFTSLDKKQIESLFLQSIQTQDKFLLIDSIRKSLIQIVQDDVTPVLFFLRFDRIKDVITQSFFDNLQGLKDASHQRLVYIFTGDRSLDVLSPAVFQKASLSVFTQVMAVKPAKEADAKIIFDTYKSRYNLTLSAEVENEILHLTGGSVQYLQLALIALRETSEPVEPQRLFDFLIADERIALQSEELFESLSGEECEVLLQLVRKEAIGEDARSKASYLWEAGFLIKDGDRDTVFSELFKNYLTKQASDVKENHEVHFSKKEHLLYTYLEKNLGQICERETIVETVWPEYSEYGVSDWAIDRLVARVRAKLKKQGSQHEIVTIRTRGYKLA